MDDSIKNILTDLLGHIIHALQIRDVMDLRKLSNDAIHNASLYQDDFSLSLAVITYALAKSITRNKLRENKDVAKGYQQIINKLDFIKKSIEQDKAAQAKQAIKSSFISINEVDEKFGLYIKEVIDQAKIKKGSVLHEQGASIARSAELLGLSEWELMNYIGKTTIAEEVTKGIPIAERMALAKKLFGIP